MKNFVAAGGVRLFKPKCALDIGEPPQQVETLGIY